MWEGLSFLEFCFVKVWENFILTLTEIRWHQFSELS